MPHARTKCEVLARIDRDIAEGERHVAEQIALIRWMTDECLDTPWLRSSFFPQSVSGWGSRSAGEVGDGQVATSPFAHLDRYPGEDGLFYQLNPGHLLHQLAPNREEQIDQTFEQWSAKVAPESSVKD